MRKGMQCKLDLSFFSDDNHAFPCGRTPALLGVLYVVMVQIMVTSLFAMSRFSNGLLAEMDMLIW